MPMGGIGTGTISLSGRGGLRDFELRNSPAKGFNPLAHSWRSAPRVRAGRSFSERFDGRMEFGAADGRARWFWSTGQAWGTLLQDLGKMAFTLSSI
jgi:hypothetical protein